MKKATKMKSPSLPTAAGKAALKKSAGKAALKKTAGKAAPEKTVRANTTAKKSAQKKTAPAEATRAIAPADRASSAVLDRLHAVILDRRTADPARSHSARLLSRGAAKVAQKFGEEAVECLIEAVAGNAAALIGESADVLYHLMVMWVAAGVQPAQVWAELARREGMSGIDEKAARIPGKAPASTTKIP